MANDQISYRHWRPVQDSEGIVWLTLDRAESGTNALSSEVLEELARLLDNIAGGSPRGVVIRSGKANGFIAGADVHEFTRIANHNEALELIQRGQSILARIEQLPVPTVAMISGFCLGGGLELALACRYRIAASTPETKLGAPEVQLGIHPGFGGTVRLTRLLGPIAALDLMLTGRAIDGRKAKQLGLVDYAVPERQLVNAARATILHPPPPRRPGLLQAIPGMAPLRPLFAWYLRGNVARKASRQHYPAPYALIDLWQRYSGNPATMYLEEARSVATLITGSTARNLLRVFFLQERLKTQGRGADFTPRFVHLIGGGTMGGDIAAWCVLQGFHVTIQDLDHGRLAKVVQRAGGLFRKKLRTPRLVQAALDRLIPDRDGAGLGRADVVIEAIFEDADAKRALYRQIEPRLRPDALLATNTSSIPLEELGQALTKPGRLVGLHFFNPVAKMQLVEVVAAAGTDPAMVARAMAFVGAIKRLPLPVKSSPGFLVNRILLPYLLEAVAMEMEGIPAGAIDRAAVEFGMPMGPILLADTVGLDICLSVARILARHYPIEVPKRLEELVAAGRLGRKSGHGFYAYKNQQPVRPPGKAAPPLSELAERLILRLLNEAVASLREKVVADGELLDAGVIFGTGFAPFHGGPLHYLQTKGPEALRQRLDEYVMRYGSRFTADQGWADLIAAGKGGA